MTGACRFRRHRATLAPHEAAKASSPFGRVSTGAAQLERCDFCGWSRHACGCEARFEYEEIRDNPRLIAR